MEKERNYEKELEEYIFDKYPGIDLSIFSRLEANHHTSSLAFAEFNYDSPGMTIIGRIKDDGFVFIKSGEGQSIKDMMGSLCYEPDIHNKSIGHFKYSMDCIKDHSILKKEEVKKEKMGEAIKKYISIGEVMIATTRTDNYIVKIDNDEIYIIPLYYRRLSLLDELDEWVDSTWFGKLIDKWAEWSVNREFAKENKENV